MLALLLIWVTLQAGIAVQFGGAKDPTSSVTVFLVQAGSIVLVVAPVLLFVLVGVKLVPKKNPHTREYHVWGSHGRRRSVAL